MDLLQRYLFSFNKPSRKGRRLQGYSLVELSVVVTILALLISGGLSILSKKDEAVKEDSGEDRMLKIEQALDSFVKLKGYLPCPSVGTLSESDAAFGKSVDYTDGTGTGSCDGIVAGGVPVRTLKLQDEYSYDGWGRKFTYRIAKGMGGPIDFNKAKYWGDLSVVDLEGREKTSLDSFGSLKQGAAYVLISHGSNGKGAWLKNSADTLGTAQGIEKENTDHSANLRYVQDKETDKFDDVVLFKKKYDLVPPKNSTAPILIPKLVCDNARSLVKTEGPEDRVVPIASGLKDFADSSADNFTIATQLYESSVLMETICNSAPDAPKIYSTPNMLAGLTFWLDAADPTGDGQTQWANDANVNTWADKSGTNKNVVAVNAPTYKTNSLNGLPTILFNGTDDYMKTAANYKGNAFVTNNASTVFIVERTDGSITSGYGHLFYWINSSSNWQWLTVFRHAGMIRYNHGEGCCTEGNNVVSANTAFNQWDIVSVVKRTDGDAVVSLDGAVANDSSMPSNPNMDTPTWPMYVGSDEPNFGQYFFKGNIAEIIIYNRGLTPDEINDIEGYLSVKWGISVSEE